MIDQEREKMGIPKSEKDVEQLDGGEEEEKGTVEMKNIEKEEKMIHGGGEKKTVVVAVKMDSQSKETLTWALVNLAHSGDHFVACHVITSPGASCSSLNLELDSMLAVYEGFCNLKQVFIFVLNLGFVVLLSVEICLVVVEI